MSSTTAFERQMFAQMLGALEVVGLVTVPANMVNALAQRFEMDNPAYSVEFGTVNDPKHNAEAVYWLLTHGEANASCWVRSNKVIEQDMIEREGIEIENAHHFKEMLLKYRREGLAWADELSLYAAVFYCPDDTLFWELEHAERDRYWELYELIEKRTERAEEKARERNKRGGR